MLVIVLIFIGLIVIWWVKLDSDVKQEEIITRPAREAEAETQRLRAKVEAEQRAADTARLIAEANERAAIKHRRELFYANVYKPRGLNWYKGGTRLTKFGGVDNAIDLYTIRELNIFIGAWRSYIARSDPQSVPADLQDYVRNIKTKFNFTKVERFGDPKTDWDAYYALERIKRAAVAAAIRAVTRYRHKQLRQLKENQNDKRLRHHRQNQTAR
jgi:hypothetical protein